MEKLIKTWSFTNPKVLVFKPALLVIYYDPFLTGSDPAFNLCDNVPIPANLNNSPSKNSTRCCQTFYESKYTTSTVSNHFLFKSYWEETNDKGYLAKFASMSPSYYCLGTENLPFPFLIFPLFYYLKGTCSVMSESSFDQSCVREDLLHAASCSPAPCDLTPLASPGVSPSLALHPNPATSCLILVGCQFLHL